MALRRRRSGGRQLYAALQQIIRVQLRQFALAFDIKKGVVWR
jgi:hypothetical protein